MKRWSADFEQVANDLKEAIELSEGFELFTAELAEASPLADWLAGALGEVRVEQLDLTMLSREAQGLVSALEARLQAAQRPCVFLAFGEPEARDGVSPFLLLNQRRERIARLASAPLVLALDGATWRRARREAPDLWSIRRSHFSFPSALRERERLRLPSLTHRVAPTEPRSAEDNLTASLLGSRPPLPPEGALPGFLELRANLLASLVQLVEPGRRIAVVGDQGVGKTTLARAGAEGAADRFLGGVVFARLGARRIDEILIDVLRALEPERALPWRTDEIVAQAEDAMRRSPVLLVVDQAGLVHGALDLQLPSGSTLLLVLNHPPDAPEIRALRVPRFAVWEMEEALHARAPHLSVERARALAHTTRGEARRFTLLWGLAGSPEAGPLLAIFGEDLSEDQIVERLADALERRLQEMDPRLLVWFRRLAALADDIPPEDLGPVAGAVPGEDPRARLASLGLITERVSGKGLVGLHPTLRQVAARLLERSGEVEAAHRSHASYFLGRLVRIVAAQAWEDLAGERSRARELEKALLLQLGLRGAVLLPPGLSAIPAEAGLFPRLKHWVAANLSARAASCWYHIWMGTHMDSTGAACAACESARLTGDLLGQLLSRPLGRQGMTVRSRNRLIQNYLRLVANKSGTKDILTVWKTFKHSDRKLFGKSIYSLLIVYQVLASDLEPPSSADARLRDALEGLHEEQDPEIRQRIELMAQTCRLVLQDRLDRIEVADEILRTYGDRILHYPPILDVFSSITGERRGSVLAFHLPNRDSVDTLLRISLAAGNHAIASAASLSLAFLSADQDAHPSALEYAKQALTELEKSSAGTQKYVLSLTHAYIARLTANQDLSEAIHHAQLAAQAARHLFEAADDEPENDPEELIQRLAHLAALYAHRGDRAFANATLTEIHRLASPEGPSDLGLDSDILIDCLRALQALADPHPIFERCLSRARQLQPASTQDPEEVELVLRVASLLHRDGRHEEALALVRAWAPTAKRLLEPGDPLLATLEEITCAGT